MDETSLNIETARITVIVPSEAKRVVRTNDGHFNHHITLILCVSADGTALEKPTVILPLSNLPKLGNDVYHSYNFAGTESGWITTEVWGQWISEVFIPHVQRVRRKLKENGGGEDQQALLWLDSHASRLNISAIRELEHANITIATLPAHTSHIIQPLDCGVNNRLKQSLRYQKTSGDIVWDQGLETYRRSLLECVMSACWDAHNPKIIRRAFESTGLVPWNPDYVLSNGAKVRVDESIPQEPENPTATQAISGKVVTSEKLIAHFKKAKEERERKETEKQEREAAREQKKAITTAMKEKREEALISRLIMKEWRTIEKEEQSQQKLNCTGKEKASVGKAVSDFLCNRRWELKPCHVNRTERNRRLLPIAPGRSLEPVPEHEKTFFLSKSLSKTHPNTKNVNTTSPYFVFQIN
jgi:hypothetical protein